MFDTPNGQRFLGALSKLANGIESLAERLKDDSLKTPWTKRDQLAWELFRLRFGLRVDRALNDALVSCYQDVDLFLSHRR